VVRDWLLSSLVTCGLWLEVAGLAKLLRRYAFREAVTPRLSFAIAFALVAQFYFIASLAGITSPSAHLALMGVGILLFLVQSALAKHSVTWALSWAWPLSLSTWKNVWPWISLPLLWLLLRVVDSLVPHNQPVSLSQSLFAARRWFEDGAQHIDPFHPQMGAAALWEGLFFHIQALSHGLGKLSSAPHRAVLLRAQLSSQQLTLTAGQILSILICAEAIAPFVKKAWRHHTGHFAGATAIGLSWIALASSPVESNIASPFWGMMLFGTSAILLCLRHRIGLGCWMIGAAVATHPQGVFLLLGVAIATFAIAIDVNYRSKLRMLARACLGFAVGLAPWLWRNKVQTGVFFYNSTAAIDLGWLPRTGIHFNAVPDEVWHFLPSALVALMFLCLITVAEAAINHFAESRLPKLRDWSPYFWFLAGLAFVPLPIHVLWQNLNYANTPPETYLKSYHRNFDAKRWAAVHLAENRRIAWTSDDEFYYVEQKSASIPQSAILRDNLADHTLPSEKTEVLCSLGFDTLAWEDRRHGSEASGMATWLKLNKQSELGSTDEVTFFDLLCFSGRPKSETL
jgi:hypothetical protein